MAINKILIVTNDNNKITEFSAKLKDDFEIIFTSYSDFEEKAQKNPDFHNVIYDLTTETTEALHKYIILSLKFVHLRTIVLINHELATQIRRYDNEMIFWCYECTECSSEILYDKIIKFKESTLTQAQRNYLLQELFDKLPIALGILTRNSSRVAFANEAFRTLTGYTPDEYLEIGGWGALTLPEDRHLDAEIQQAIEEKGENHINYEKRIIHKSGEIIWLEVFMDIINRTHDDYIRIIMSRNITHRKELAKHRDEMNKRTQRLMNNLPGLAFRCANDEHWTMEFVSEGSFILTGYKPEELVNNNIESYNNIILPKYQERLRTEWANAIKSRQHCQFEYEIKMKNGQPRWVFERGVPVYDENDELIAIEGIIIDASRSKKLESELKYMNEFNQKLKLPNREMLARKLQAVIDSKSGKCTLILINLKDTQKLYRSHGYEYVELLTASLVNKLSALETNIQQLYYVEQDMYGILIKKKWNQEYLKECVLRIKDAILNTITREQIRCNVGVSFINKSSVYAEDFIRRARVASEFVRDENELFSAHLFDTEMETKVKREDKIKQELIDTSYSDETTKLRLVFQPLIELKTGKITGFEALARYKSEAFGQISPVEFIPIVEKNRIAVAFGKKIIDLAIIFIKKLMAQGINDVPISVNISTLQLLDPWFVVNLLKKLKEAEVPTNLFIVELTETVFSTNLKLLNERLTELSEAGIRAALDDFGTGFSSLSRVEELRFNTIKIDKSFIQKLTAENMHKTTIPEIINICHKFNLASLAEGIETEEQYNLLRDIGCKYGQGYYMSRPLEVDDALAFTTKEQK